MDLNQEVVRLYEKGLSCSAIARELGYSFKKIRPIIVKNFGKLTKRYRKYKVNDNFFKHIDNEEKAYWLGFLMADGCVDNGRDKRIRLQIIDKEHIEKLKDSMNSNSPIGTVNPNLQKRANFKYKTNAYYIDIYSRDNVESLIKLGVVPKKTGKEQEPNIYSALKRHFWRGVIDGDGTIRFLTGRNCFCSLILFANLKFANQFKDFCSDYLGEDAGSVYNYKCDTIPRYQISGYKALLILQHLYEDSTVYLDRKYHIYERVKEEYVVRSTRFFALNDYQKYANLEGKENRKNEKSQYITPKGFVYLEEKKTNYPIKEIKMYSLKEYANRK